MYIKGNKSKLFISKDRDLNDAPLLFIHGFTGSHKSWTNIRASLNYPSIVIDIPGHGKSIFNRLDDEYYFNDFTNELYLALLHMNIKKIHICGYSLGGRLALCFAAKYPELIESLFLESTTIGFEPGDEKKICFENDKKLSSLIEKDYIKFIEKWNNKSLFIEQKNRNLEEFNHQNDIRQSHNNMQLSHSLRTFSKGNMPYMLHQFQKFNFPITIINGKDDIKYIKEGRIMLNLNNNAKQYIVNDASHNVHLENNDFYSELIYNHIESCT